MVLGTFLAQFFVSFEHFGVILGIFLSTFGSLGRPWDPLWAPLGARCEKVRKMTPFYNEKLVHFGALFATFC